MALRAERLASAIFKRVAECLASLTEHWFHVKWANTNPQALDDDLCRQYLTREGELDRVAWNSPSRAVWVGPGNQFCMNDVAWRKLRIAPDTFAIVYKGLKIIQITEILIPNGSVYLDFVSRNRDVETSEPGVRRHCIGLFPRAELDTHFTLASLHVDDRFVCLVQVLREFVWSEFHINFTNENCVWAWVALVVQPDACNGSWWMIHRRERGAS